MIVAALWANSAFDQVKGNPRAKAIEDTEKAFDRAIAMVMGWEVPKEPSEEEDIDWDHPFFRAIKIEGWENPADRARRLAEDEDEDDFEVQRPTGYDQEPRRRTPEPVPSRIPDRIDPVDRAKAQPKMVYIDPNTIEVPAWASKARVVNADADDMFDVLPG